MPKPLIEIGDGVVFLDVVIEQLVRHAFDDIVLLAGHLGDIVRERYHGRSVGPAHVRVVVEPEPRGTAGALIAARDLIAARFLMLNGDSFFDIDLRELCATYDSMACEALIALHRVADASRYGSVVLDGERVVRFLEKNTAIGAAMINAGIYVLPSSIIDRIGALPCSMETDIFPMLAAERRLCGRPFEGYFIDIGLPETLQQARRELLARVHRPTNFQSA
jgi:D-glycero-D-manno-heptose 1,7-bisphosphate phosphatase